MNRLVSGSIVGLGVLLVGCQMSSPRSGSAPAIKQAKVEGATLSYIEQGQGCLWCSCTVLSPTIGPGTRSAIRPHGSTATLPMTSATSGPRPGRTTASASRSLPMRTTLQCSCASSTSDRHISSAGRMARTSCSCSLVQHPALVRSPFLYEPSMATVVTEPADLKAVNEDSEKMSAEGIAAVQAKTSSPRSGLCWTASTRCPAPSTLIRPRRAASPSKTRGHCRSSSRHRRRPRPRARSWARSRRQPPSCEARRRGRSSESLPIRRVTASPARG